MSILRMLEQLDAGNVENLRKTLDTPHPQEDVLYVTDHWLTTLSELEQKAHEFVKYIHNLISA
jgi:hypothetical protein